MYSNCGYLNNSSIAFEDHTKPLTIASCGAYTLRTLPEFLTVRPNGRVDYQLLYIASGKMHFFFETDVETVVSAGHMVLYHPLERQDYKYLSEEHPEVYWVHFTGRDVESLLSQYGLCGGQHVFHTGTSPSYQRLFRLMIQELQLCRPHFENALALQFQELLISISRHMDIHLTENTFSRKEMEDAIHYFNENYNQNINIKTYAESRHMSTSGFIRNFKRYCNMTPLNYILSIRIAHAKSLLENTSYNISEIASIVGYDNPLYFSRMFHKHEGFSPSEYRNRLVHL